MMLPIRILHYKRWFLVPICHRRILSPWPSADPVRCPSLPPSLSVALLPPLSPPPPLPCVGSFFVTTVLRTSAARAPSARPVRSFAQSDRSRRRRSSSETYVRSVPSSISRAQQEGLQRRSSRRHNVHFIHLSSPRRRLQVSRVSGLSSSS